MIHADSVKAWEAESNTFREIIMKQREEIERLRGLLARCKTILGNMALENEGAVFNRWPINHEPLRADARGLLSEMAALDEQVAQ